MEDVTGISMRGTLIWQLEHDRAATAMQIGGWAVVSVLNGGSLALLTIANALVNGYPILLQRYNRVRVPAALGRIGQLKDPAGREDATAQ